MGICPVFVLKVHSPLACKQFFQYKMFYFLGKLHLLLGLTMCWVRERSSTLYVLSFGADGKESACNAVNLGSIPGSGRCPGRGHGNPLQYSCMETSMDRGAWWTTVHGAAGSDTTDWLTLSLSHLILKKMDIINSTLWRILTYSDRWWIICSRTRYKLLFKIFFLSQF